MLAAALVFSVEGQPYCWRDVILAAVRSGDWRAAVIRARRGAACVLHAGAGGPASADGVLDAAAREFRYARGLVTAQSMEAWLERHRLTVQDWTAWLRRTLQLARLGSECDELVALHPIDDDEASRLALIDIVCSSQLDAWTRRLAELAAAHAFVESAASATDADETQSRENGSAPLPGVLPTILRDDDTTALRAAAARLQRLDESLARFRATQVTERAVSDYVSGRRLDWVRLSCRVMSFPDHDMAAEAALMLREDGERFTGVYRVAQVEPRTARFFLDELEEPLYDNFVGARAGDLIGPVLVDDEYRLYEVEEKILPSVECLEVRRRAEEALLQRSLTLQVEQRVRWLVAT